MKATKPLGGRHSGSRGTKRCPGSRSSAPPAQANGHVGVHDPTPEGEDGLGVDLADAGLGDAQDLADLLEGHLVLVVKGEDHARPFAEPSDLVDKRNDGVASRRLLGRIHGILVPDAIGQHG